MKHAGAGLRTLEGLPLSVQAEAELERAGLRLAFPPALEARYRSDTGAERARELRVIMRLGAILYVSAGLLLQLLVVAHPSGWLTAVHLGGSLAFVLVVAQCFLQPKTPDALREAALLTCCLVCALAAILVERFSPARVTAQDFILAALPTNFALIFVRLRFPAAAAFATLTFAVFVASVVTRQDLAPRDIGFPIGVMAVLCLPSLVGVHAFERASRRIYLHGLLQRLRNEHVAVENTTLADLSLTDPLTRIANRRRLDTDLRIFCDAPGAGGALLLIDLDRFKLLNDQHGHLAGDACLRMVAQCLALHLRRRDLLARFGGEEFAVLLPGMTVAEAAYAAEHLRSAVQAQTLAVAGMSVSVTVSIGVAVHAAGMAPEQLIGAADAALYAAKRGGRNQVAAADAADPA